MATFGDLRIDVLGTFRLWRGTDRVDAGPAQQRAVLALLALNAGRVVRRADLIDAVWQHGPPQSAANVLQTYVKRLRRAMEPERGPRRPAEVLVTSGDGYLLRVPEDRVDVFRFRALMVDARAAGMHEAALAHYADAFALWRDVPLPDVPALSGHRVVAELVEEHASALCEYADVAMAQGRAGEVLPMLRRAAEAEPTHERLHARLLACHRRTGHRTTAFTVYRRIQRQLREDFGVDPSPELRAAYLELLADEPAAEPVASGPFPAPAQLPPDIAEFTGRDVEQATLVDALADVDPAGAVPVWLISGLGGIGKTALAVRVAHRLAPIYRDGQLYADLTDARPAEVLAQFLVGLGVDRSVVPDELNERVAMYRSRTAGRRLLVVLDNAAAEALVRPLVPGSATCAVLVTSRSRLPGLSSAELMDLGQLTGPEARSLLRAVAGRGRDWDDETARAIVGLCDLIPLAIRIAGARLARRSDVSLARFAGQLADGKARLDILTTGDVGVRACFALTYADLSPHARLVFVCFGLLEVDHVASWVLAVAARLSTVESELAVDELVGTRLFTPLGTDTTGEPRYGMHDLVRLYAAERAAADLTGDERRGVVERVLTAWLAMAWEGDRRLPYRTLPDPAGVAGEPPAPRLLADAAGWFEVERDQLRGIVGQATRSGWPDLAWRLADACAGFYEARDHYDDWRQTHLACLAVCSRDGAFTMARNLAYQYSLPVLRGTAVAEYAERALDSGVAAGHIAEARVLLALAALARADFAAATDLVDRARADAAPGSPVDLAALGVLGVVSRLRGDLDAAAAHFTELLRHNSGRRHNGYELTAMRTLAIIRRDQQRYGEAIDLLTEGVRVARDVGVRANELLMLIELGEVSALARRPTADLARAVRLAETMSSEIGVALAWRAMSTVDLLRGDLVSARDRLERSLAVQQREGLPHVQAHTLKALGGVHARLGDSAAAVESWRQARAIYAILGNQTEITAIDRDLAALADE